MPGTRGAHLPGRREIAAAIWRVACAFAGNAEFIERVGAHHGANPAPIGRLAAAAAKRTQKLLVFLRQDLPPSRD
jgi:hypothetical protein